MAYAAGCHRATAAATPRRRSRSMGPRFQGVRRAAINPTSKRPPATEPAERPGSVSLCRGRARQPCAYAADPAPHSRRKRATTGRWSDAGSSRRAVGSSVIEGGSPGPVSTRSTCCTSAWLTRMRSMSSPRPRNTRLKRRSAGISGARFHSRAPSPSSGRSKPLVLISAPGRPEQDPRPSVRQAPRRRPRAPSAVRRPHVSRLTPVAERSARDNPRAHRVARAGDRARIEVHGRAVATAR
jgi:hypothetical protein